MRSGVAGEIRGLRESRGHHYFELADKGVEAVGRGVAQQLEVVYWSSRRLSDRTSARGGPSRSRSRAVRRCCAQGGPSGKEDRSSVSHLRRSMSKHCSGASRLLAVDSSRHWKPRASCRKSHAFLCRWSRCASGRRHEPWIRSAPRSFLSATAGEIGICLRRPPRSLTRPRLRSSGADCRCTRTTRCCT